MASYMKRFDFKSPQLTPIATTPSVLDERFESSLASRIDTKSGAANQSTRDSNMDLFEQENIVSSSNPTQLFVFIKSKDWTKVVKKCRSNNRGDKDEASTWIVEKNTDGTVRWKLLPIHQACEIKAPSEVIKALIDAYPEGLRMKDSGGDLPLHLACRERASKAVISSVLSAYVDAATIPDDEGRLPLHLACRQGAQVEAVSNLINAYHRASRTPDSYSLLPIHWACAQNASEDIVEVLLRANPDALDAEDKWGRTPLTLAMSSSNPDKEKVITALKRDPSYWTTNLLKKIDNLQSRCEETDSKAKGLERKLQEVTLSNTNASTTFNEVKRELENENERLKDQVRTLTTRCNKAEEIMEQLNDENGRLKRHIKNMESRISLVQSVFKGLEMQRMAIMGVAGQMEENIKKAEIAMNDDM
jgi:hypothetical protein